jgi:hypothetical protein
MTRPLCARYPVVQEAVWAAGLVCRTVRNRPTRLQTPNRPARRRSLYPLRFPGPFNASRLSQDLISSLSFRECGFYCSFLNIWIPAAQSCLCVVTGVHKCLQNSRRPKGDMTQCSHLRPTNIGHYITKFSPPGDLTPRNCAPLCCIVLHSGGETRP